MQPSAANRSARFDAATEAAVGWLVELRSGQATAATRQAFQAWLAAEPSHQAAWDKLGRALGSTFAGLEPRGGAATGQGQLVDRVLARLDTRSRRRRLVGGALGLAGLGVGTAWLARQIGALPDMVADLHTGTAERRQWTLPDGSALLLDARSSADLDFAAGRRRVRLREGQLIADARPAGAEPFVAQSRHGWAQAPDTRLLLRQDADRTLVVALRHAVRVAAAGGARQAVLQQGEGAWLSPAGVAPADAVEAALAADWQGGMLSVRNTPLAELVHALQAYRRGLIRISPQAGAIRVSGRYALDDTDATLRVWAETLPVSVHTYPGGWLVTIDRRPA